MKGIIIPEEYYPFYSIMERVKPPYELKEISDEFFQEYTRIMLEFENLQEKLDNMYSLYKFED